MSTLLKWAQTTQGKLTNSKNNNNERKWIHPPENLQKGHIVYLVKFLGNTLVDEPKGIEVVKEAIRKLKFTQQLRKSENGGKTKKIELTVSVDGVAIQEPRTHNILHQFPLHQISYCADDKGEKRFFSFIAKHQNTDEEPEEKHSCFVFISDKLAEEITLTIGQAFELAYKRFLETSGKELESQQKAILIQQKMKKLEKELGVYKQRLLDLSGMPGIRLEVEEYLRKKNLRTIVDLEVGQMNGSGLPPQNNGIREVEVADIIDFNGSAPPIPPRALDNTPIVGTKLEGLLMNELDHDDDFDPRSFENNNNVKQNTNLPLIAPPPKPAKRTNLSLNMGGTTTGSDMLQLTPSTPSVPTPNSISSSKIDPFEMGDFGSSSSTFRDMENAIGMLDKKIMEMKAGFSRGISFGNDDFFLESLDPLKN
ncbi:PTB domain-containing adapter protein ced-6 [Anthonomus grandis grandis]|uniref:PTB domain-containing adapter protein ced-6 n=1 Tax=Anthonomus grandis grandis TaxID=2921223 RepID=UPI002165EA15|nr:PTB domain-containing adapter protein ced-6 [Anthonomus grandis grandis]